ncbi:unnamed protein product [Sphenostylis stenocarpa]|uniref:cyclin-dependent kinase n=1 Tax=Sphenostylis stenocarpa TaxID=92480 RepID=A0AA87BCU6_9FABA|nr:unnamed protein product [Sphenostylis stenocarpa]
MNMLKEKYTNFEAISNGIFKCKHYDQSLVIKIISIPTAEHRNGVPKEIIREVSLLKELDHTNVVRLVDVMSNKRDVFLVFECLDNTLHNFLINPAIFLYPTLIKEFLFQIVNAVAYIHSRKILHRDLRPENILIDFGTHAVKISDFGSARTFEVPFLYSNKVGCPFYRAPELLLGSSNYSTPNDIWSVGCIFGEMVLGQPLFRGGSDMELLNEIFTFLGTPTEETWPGVTSFRKILAQMGPRKEPKDMNRIFSELEPAGIDLLSLLFEILAVSLILNHMGTRKSKASIARWRMETQSKFIEFGLNLP